MARALSALESWTPEQIAAGRRWAATWKSTGPELERIRRQELRRIDAFETIALLCGPADYRVPPRPQADLRARRAAAPLREAAPAVRRLGSSNARAAPYWGDGDDPPAGARRRRGAVGGGAGPGGLHLRRRGRRLRQRGPVRDRRVSTGDRRLELHVRRSLGLVRYHFGEESLSHEDLVRGVRALDESRRRRSIRDSPTIPPPAFVTCAPTSSASATSSSPAARRPSGP